jgi:hypothetical protein
MRLSVGNDTASGGQVLGGWPVPSIDPLEYCRGQLAAFSYVSATAAREVHILRLRNSFERAGIGSKLRYSLLALNLMREVQELGGGYWFPTPLRVVPVDEQGILVGAITTSELQRHFHGVARAGYARVSNRADVASLPEQALDDWLRLEVRDTVAWTEAQVAVARAGLGPTISTASIQFFSVATTQSPPGPVIKPAWTDDARSSLPGPQGLVLCRERTAPERHRYFLGRVDGRRLTAEGPTPSDVTRLQFGLAALAGKPLTVDIVSRHSEFVFRFSAAVPRPEYQLTLALGVRDFTLPGKTFRVRNEGFSRAIVSRLRNLGCEVRSTGA